jgi:Outer membrane protein beta-barrel domain
VKSASVLGCVLAGCCLFLSTHATRAQESPLGLYVGAGVGTATVRQDPGPDTGYYGFAREDFGWDAFIGVRPSPYLGAEIGFLDFGHTDHNGYYTGYYAPANASAHAPVGFAVGYLPVNPWWDVYLKAGAARLYRAWNFTAAPCPPYALCPAGLPSSYVGSSTDWDFAWGIGTQWKFGPTAVRLEYQRVETGGSTNSGDPDMLSVGVSWTFF